jgi:hypothetical protein
VMHWSNERRFIGPFAFHSAWGPAAMTKSGDRKVQAKG